MKNILLYFSVFALFISMAQGQDINLVFTAQDSVTTAPVSLDSVIVYNITSACDTVIYGPDPVLALSPLGANEPAISHSDAIELLPPYPNPARGTAHFEIILRKAGPTEISVYNLAGTALCRQQYMLGQGQHRFILESAEKTVLLIHVSTASYTSTAKLMNIGGGGSRSMIAYLDYKQSVVKTVSMPNSFVFSPGDLLSYTVIQDGYHPEINYDSPADDTTYTFLMNPIKDGWYVVGGSTAYDELNENAMLQVARNEVTQEIDSNLFDLFIPVLSGEEGFNIVKVSGTDISTYEPYNFHTVYSGLDGEPEVPFQRGSYAVGSNRFMVPDDGMYHIAIYTQTQKVVVVPVHWGMIGTATYNFWNSSIPMNESPFDYLSMSWTLDSIDLFNGVWKYRYSDGWKVMLDTTLDLGGGNVGVSVNANLGESVDSLVPGGVNIVNNLPGIYSSTLDYTLGSGYEASLIFVDTLPQTDWNGVVCDAVGTGISPANLSAVPDPSSWNWGYRIIADNKGMPIALGHVYTWTWSNVMLEAYEGFKLRTLDGLPSPLNNMYFDAGYLYLNTSASSPYIISGGAPDYNLVSTINASFSIILNIDAANDNEKEIIITLD